MASLLSTFSFKSSGRRPRICSASLWVALLIGLIFTGDRLFSVGLKQLLLASEFRYSNLYAGRSRADVLIIGNSRALNCCYAPAIQQKYGISAINLAYNGLPMEMAAALIEDYYDLNVPPKILIIEATSLTHGNYSRDIYLYAAVSRRLRKLFEADLPNRYLTEKLFHLQTYNRETFLRVLYYLRRSDQNWINRYRISPEIVRESHDMSTTTWENRKENINALMDVMSIANRFGTRVVIIVSPYLPGYIDKVLNFDAWLTELRTLVGGQATVWDYSRALTDLDYFADRVHLNEDGSRRLLDIMRNDGIFVIKGPRETDPPGASGNH